MDSANVSIAKMPRGGPQASWLDRLLETDALEYTDREDIPDAIKQQVVSELDRLGARRGFHEKFAALAVGQVAEVPQPHILELGAGHGRVCEQILRLHPGARVTVSDLDPKSVSNIAAGPLGDNPRAHAKVIDAVDIDMPDDSFDLVVFAQSFHHLPPVQAVRAISEATRVGRRFLVIDLYRPPAVPMVVLSVLTFPLMIPQLLRSSGRALMHDAMISRLRAYSRGALRALGEAADPGMTVRFVPVGLNQRTGVLYQRPTR